MPWNPCDAMKLKRDFVELAGREGANMRELCRRFGIAAPTGYKWLARFREQGDEGLRELSRRPQASPAKTDAGLEAKILEVRATHPVWGGRKIRRWLQDRGFSGVPSASTVTGVLRRHGLLATPAGPSGKGWNHFEKSSANELWQMDFKGWIRTRNEGPCHPLTLLDDHSRYNLLLEACGRETLGEVKPLLERAFTIHGLPAAILCDNGAPWGDAAGFFTKFEVWLLRLGVRVSHGRPCHPQTQGKEERFHRTLKAEVLSRTTEWRDLEHCQASFQAWRQIYNHERPHEALGGAVPMSRYRASERAMPEKLAPAGEWYGKGDVVKKVSGKGTVSMRGKLWAIGEAFSGEEIALREVGENRHEVYYCWKKLGVMDLGAAPDPAGSTYRQLSERAKSRRITQDVQF
jgi:transposase InsO family protein